MKAALACFVPRALCTLPSALALYVISGCQSEPEEKTLETACAAQSVIYDTDDREELSQIGKAWRNELSSRVVALVSRGLADALANNELDESALTAASIIGLCQDERFAEQPVLAECTGFMLTQDILLTAGHCASAVENCSEYAYVTGFANVDETARPFARIAARECVEVLDLQTSGDSDYALLRLSRDDSAPDPASITEPEPDGEHVVVASYPSGLPLKVDLGAAVSERSPQRLLISADTFVGSSGAPVYNRHGGIFGMLVGGEPDYEESPSEHCLRSRHVEGAGREVVLPVMAILQQACKRKPSLDVCSVEWPEPSLPDAEAASSAPDAESGHPAHACSEE